MSDCIIWVEKFSEQHGRKFWKNNETGEKTWIDPFAASKASSSPENDETHRDKTSLPCIDSDSYPPPLQGHEDEGEDWEEKFSEKHKKSYFVNKKTRRTSWVIPSRTGSSEDINFSHSPDDGDDAVNWEKRYSEKHGKHYFVNKKTRRSSWVVPESVKSNESEPSDQDDAEGKDDEWIRKYSQKHNKAYFINKKTRRTSWAVPEGAKPVFPSDEWEKKFSEEHGRPYYVNKLTRRSSWVAPAALQVDNDGASQSGRALKKGYSTTDANSEEWIEKYSEKHKKSYFINKKTRRKSWILPNSGTIPLPETITEDTNSDIPLADNASAHIERKGEAPAATEPSSQADATNKLERISDMSKSSVDTTQESNTTKAENENIISNSPSCPNAQVDTHYDNANVISHAKSDDRNIGSPRAIDFGGDISAIAPSDSPQKFHVKSIALKEYTEDNVKKFSVKEVADTLNYYQKAIEGLEFSLSQADAKLSKMTFEKDEFVSDNELLRQTVHEYAAQHQARELKLQELEAHVSLLEKERDEAIHNLERAQLAEVDRDVASIIKDEAEKEIQDMSDSQKSHIQALKAENELLRKEKDSISQEYHALRDTCEKATKKKSELERQLVCTMSDMKFYEESNQSLKASYSSLEKKLNSSYQDISLLKKESLEALEKNRRLVLDNSKLIKRVNILQHRLKNKHNHQKIRKIVSSSPKLSCASGIHVPVKKIQCSNHEILEKNMNLNAFCPEFNTSIEELLKRREEMETGWVFVDLATFPLTACLTADVAS